MPDKNQDANESSETERKPQGIALIEWVIAFIGLGIVLAVLGFLLVKAVQDRGEPPSLRFDVSRIEAVSDGYVVDFVVTNDGDTAAADVRIVGQLRNGETVTEEQEMTLDYAPPHSSRRGGLFFSADPETGNLSLRASGYMEP